MKILPIIILLLSFSVVGQKRKPTPKPTPPPQPKFSYDWDKIPFNFYGDNFVKIYEYLLLNQPKLSKDEFETTEQYKKRLNDPASVKINENLTAADTLIFVYRPGQFDIGGLGDIESEYNADTQTLNIYFESVPVDAYARGITDTTKITFNCVKSSPVRANSSSFIGQNSYGVKATVTKFEFHYYYLGFDNLDQLPTKKELFRTKIEAPLKLLPDQARALKNNLAALYIVNLKAPYFTVDYEKKTATIDDPKAREIYREYLVGSAKEIWIFNKSTGEVISKLKPKTTTE